MDDNAERAVWSEVQQRLSRIELKTNALVGRLAAALALLWGLVAIRIGGDVVSRLISGDIGDLIAILAAVVVSLGVYVHLRRQKFDSR